MITLMHLYCNVTIKGPLFPEAVTGTIRHIDNNSGKLSITVMIIGDNNTKTLHFKERGGQWIHLVINDDSENRSTEMVYYEINIVPRGDPF